MGEEEVMVRKVIISRKPDNVGDNRGITKRPEYLKLLVIARLLDQTLRNGKYTSGERNELKKAFDNIQLVKELMM
jgi:hypothetical protein